MRRTARPYPSKGGAALEASQRFTAFDAVRFALGNVPSLAAHGAQNAAFDDLLAETFQQLILRFILS